MGEISLSKCRKRQYYFNYWFRLDWERYISISMEKNDAAYVFDTAVLDSSLYNGQNVLYLAHTTALMRTQNRKSIRVPCKIPRRSLLLTSL